MMSRIRSSVVDVLLRALDPIERDVVEGDFNEMHLPQARALRELSGLLVRRQLAAWLDWRPWAAVVFVALPLGMVLSLVSRYWANVTAIYAWLYIDNWTSGYLASPGARSYLLHTTTVFSVECVALNRSASRAPYRFVSARTLSIGQPREPRHTQPRAYMRYETNTVMAVGLCHHACDPREVLRGIRW